MAAVGDNGPLAAALRGAGFAVLPIDLMRSRKSPRGAFEVARVIRSARPDLVHFHGTRAGYFGALGRFAAFRGPTVYSAHGLAYRKERAALRRVAFLAAEGIACRGATRVVSVSRADLEDLERRHLVAAGCGHHVGNAVRAPTGDPASARQRLGIASDVFVVGTVSRLVAQKSVSTLIEAAAASTSGVRLVVVGDGPERGSLAELANRRRVDVVFLGERDDVPDLLPGLDLFVLSSKWEGEPVALLEAMAAGLPCVATATEGARELLSSCGVLVGVDRPAELARAIDALRCDAEERDRLGRAARAATRDRSYHRVANKLADVYSACERARFGLTESP
jgi:glycosyltransferase involved in cell wall biosynthesis